MLSESCGCAGRLVVRRRRRTTYLYTVNLVRRTNTMGIEHVLETRFSH